MITNSIRIRAKSLQFIEVFCTSVLLFLAIIAADTSANTGSETTASSQSTAAKNTSVPECRGAAYIGTYSTDTQTPTCANRWAWDIRLLGVSSNSGLSDGVLQLDLKASRYHKYLVQNFRITKESASVFLEESERTNIRQEVSESEETDESGNGFSTINQQSIDQNFGLQHLSWSLSYRPDSGKVRKWYDSFIPFIAFERTSDDSLNIDTYNRNVFGLKYNVRRRYDHLRNSGRHTSEDIDLSISITNLHYEAADGTTVDSLGGRLTARYSHSFSRHSDFSVSTFVDYADDIGQQQIVLQFNWWTSTRSALSLYNRTTRYKGIAGKITGTVDNSNSTTGIQFIYRPGTTGRKS